MAFACLVVPEEVPVEALDFPKSVEGFLAGIGFAFEIKVRPIRA